MRRHVYHLRRIIGHHLSAHLGLRFRASQNARSQGSQEHKGVSLTFKVFLRVLLRVLRCLVSKGPLALFPQFRGGHRLATYLITARAKTTAHRILRVNRVKVLLRMLRNAINRRANSLRDDAFQRLRLCLGVTLIFCQRRTNERRPISGRGNGRCRTRHARRTTKVPSSPIGSDRMFIVTRIRPFVSFTRGCILFLSAIKLRCRQARSKAGHRNRCHEGRCKGNSDGNGLAMWLSNSSTRRAC